MTVMISLNFDEEEMEVSVFHYIDYVLCNIHAGFKYYVL
jgi:hypothetical protein